MVARYNTVSFLWYNIYHFGVLSESEDELGTTEAITEMNKKKKDVGNYVGNRDIPVSTVCQQIDSKFDQKNATNSISSVLS